MRSYIYRPTGSCGSRDLCNTTHATLHDLPYLTMYGSVRVLKRCDRPVMQQTVVYSYNDSVNE